MNTIIVAFDDVNSPEIIDIRTQVFVKEQGVDASIDFDGQDASAVNVLVRDDDKAIATARMLDDGHIGRITVLKHVRNQGAGSCALDTLINVAKERGLKRVYLGSQTHATGFYLKKGFKAFGNIFMEAGIEHVDMELYLIS